MKIDMRIRLIVESIIMEQVNGEDYVITRLGWEKSPKIVVILNRKITILYIWIKFGIFADAYIHALKSEDL